MPITTIGSKLLTGALLADPVPPEFGDRIGAPAFFIISLFTTNPDVSGNNYVEPSSEFGYKRSFGTFSAVPESTTALGGFLFGAELVNSSEIVFPEAIGAWGQIVGCGIHYPVNVNLYPQYNDRPIFYQSLNLVKIVNSGDVAVFEPGEIKIFLGADR